MSINPVNARNARNASNPIKKIINKERWYKENFRDHLQNLHVTYKTRHSAAKNFRKYFRNLQVKGDMMIEISIIGLFAGLLTTGSQLPQAYKVYKSGSTGDLSAWWLLALLAGTIVWLVYGLLIVDLPLIIWNSISIFTVGYIAARKFNIIKTKTDSSNMGTSA
jgi:MtN3 and saliva related transmembrane protein